MNLLYINIQNFVNLILGREVVCDDERYVQKAKFSPSITSRYKSWFAKKLAV